jgi:hypothetical protein
VTTKELAAGVERKLELMATHKLCCGSTAADQSSVAGPGSAQSTNMPGWPGPKHSFNYTALDMPLLPLLHSWSAHKL